MHDYSATNFSCSEEDYTKQFILTGFYTNIFEY